MRCRAERTQQAAGLVREVPSSALFQAAPSAPLLYTYRYLVIQVRTLCNKQHLPQLVGSAPTAAAVGSLIHLLARRRPSQAFST